MQPPPVTIINAEIDPLRSYGELLQAALKQAGVKVERKVYSASTYRRQRLRRAGNL